VGGVVAFADEVVEGNGWGRADFEGRCGEGTTDWEKKEESGDLHDC